MTRGEVVKGEPTSRAVSRGRGARVLGTEGRADPEGARRLGGWHGPPRSWRLERGTQHVETEPDACTFPRVVLRSVVVHTSSQVYHTKS
eukprot:5276186-Prymnesium_polylepis.1